MTRSAVLADATTRLPLYRRAEHDERETTMSAVHSHTGVRQPLPQSSWAADCTALPCPSPGALSWATCDTSSPWFPSSHPAEVLVGEGDGATSGDEEPRRAGTFPG
jgi:hypothetical protein